MRIFITLLLAVISMILGCSTDSGQKSQQSTSQQRTNSSEYKQPPRKVIAYLGSTVGWFEDSGAVLKDFTVSGLRVRISTIYETQSRCKTGNWRFIEIDGPINKDSSYILDKVLSENTNCITEAGTKIVPIVFMNSSGGKLEDGYSIGRVLRKYDAATILTTNQVCASACAIAFLGGKYRNMVNNAQLIFHAPYVKVYDFGMERIKCADAKAAKPLSEYYQEMLGSTVAQKVFERTMDFCSTVDGWTLDPGAADFFGIIRK